MKSRDLLLMALMYAATNFAWADPPTLNTLLKEYAAQGAGKPDIQAGKRLWSKNFNGDKSFPERRCSMCHSKNLRQSGQHVRTKKVLKPMAPAVNPERLTSTRKVKKWLKRNCKWTLGRECTASEKANLLFFISQQ